MFENDYIMRQIEILTNFLAKLILGKESPEYKLKNREKDVAEDSDLLFLTLKHMIDIGEINKAENLLYDRIENEPTYEYLEVALDFYNRLEKFDDELLEKCNFSKIEVLDGLENIKKIYGIETP